MLSLPDVPGALAFTARFVPAIGDLVAPSQSPAVANPRAPPGAVVTGVRDRYATGETITATALITPERPDHTASWWTRADDRVTDRGTGPTLTLPATADLDGALLGFDVRDLRGRVVATARAVPLAVAPAPPTTTAPDPAPTPPATTAPSGTPPSPAEPPTGPAATTRPCVPTPVTRVVEPGEVEVVTDGHFDYGPVVEGGSLTARVEDDRDGEPVFRDPGGTCSTSTTPPAPHHRPGPVTTPSASVRCGRSR